MPELPEVEIVKRGLNEFLPGKIFASEIHDWPKGFPNADEDVKGFLLGAKILEVKRRAKVLIIELDTKYSLVIHLKMTGQLVFVAKNLVDGRRKMVDGETEGPDELTTNYQLPTTKDEVRFGAGHPSDSLTSQLPAKSTRVTFTFTDDSKLFFNDQRKFGWVRLLPTAEVPNIDFFKKVGPEPLAADFTPAVFKQQLMRRKNSNIKSVLLDQSVIAGIGNIYADESLWAAKIHPEMLVKNISQAKLNTLFVQLRQVLELSINMGGSSDRNYVDAKGQRGSYLNFANVFRREGQPCRRHPDTMIVKTRVAGRGTHTCPICQRKPR